jgi:hypothetical protein
MTTLTETAAPAATVNPFAKPFAKVANDLAAAETKVRGLMRIAIGYAALAGKARQVEAILDATKVADSTKRTIKATAARVRDFIDDGHATPLGAEHANDREAVRGWIDAIMAKVGATSDAALAGLLRDYVPPMTAAEVLDAVVADNQPEPTAEATEGKPLSAQPSPNGKVAIPAKAEAQPTISAKAEPTLAEQMTGYCLAMAPEVRREWLVGLFAKLSADEQDSLITTLSAAPTQTVLDKAA